MRQQESLEITAGMMVEAINRKGGKPISVSVGNYGTAFTDGNRIAIPSFPEEKRFIGLAYLGHEASHCRITDMEKYGAFAQQGPIHQNVLNIVEDIRIERSITRIYPGLIAQLKRLVEHLVETKLFKKPTKRDHPLEIFMAWLLYTRRAQVLGQNALDKHAKVADRLVREAFGDAFIDTMEADLVCLKTMDITPKGIDESIALAQKILDLLKQKAQDEQQEQPQQGQQGNGGEQSDEDGDESQESSQGQSGDSGEQSSQSQADSGEDGDESQSSEGDGGNTGSQSESGDEEEKSGSGQDGQSEDSESSDGSGGSGGDSEGDDESEGSAESSASGQGQDDLEDQAPSSNDPQKSQSSDGRGGGPATLDLENYQPKQRVDLGEITEELARKNQKHDDKLMDVVRPLRRLTKGEDESIGTYPLVIEVNKNRNGDCYSERVASLEASISWVDRTSRSLAGPVRREMRAILEGEDRVRFDPRRSGRLNRRALSGVATGESRVFHRKIEGKAQRAAVHVMLDASGSMKGQMEDALVAVHSMLDALEPLRGVNTGFSVFPADTTEEDSSGNLVFRDAVTSLVKAHGESLSAAKRRREYYPYPRGSTPMVSSMMGVIPVLLSQPEERKVLIVATDGAPNEGVNVARAKIEEYRALGVEIIGIGIDSDTVKYTFGENHSIYVTDVKQLPKAFKKVVRSTIF